jgi:hypothetical protein
MKNVVGIFTLVLLITLSGCSSLSTWVRSNLEGVPVWVYEPQISRNQSAFIGRGTAAGETRARVLAYESVLRQISEYIGRDVTGLHIAELSSRNAIDSYRLRVTQEFVKEDASGITVFFLAVADREVLETARTEAEVLLLERQRQMDRLMQEGAQAFRENRDTIAAEKYIQTALIAASLPVDRGERQYAEAVDRVRSILRQLTISIAQGDPSVPTTSVTVRRGPRSLSPRVEGAPVVAYSIARDALGRQYEDMQQFVTDGSGQILYTPSNPTIIGDGQLVFMIHLERALAPIAEIDPELHAELIDLIEAKQVVYPYRRISILQSRTLLVALSEYSLQGDLLTTSLAASGLASELAKDGIRMDLTRPSGIVDEDEDLIATLRQRYPEYPLVMYGNVGVSHHKNTERGAVVTVAGEAMLIDLTRQVVLGRTSTVQANAIGASLEEARGEAFTRFGAISASLLYRYLYR